jgi:hypothetical protein
MLMSRQEYRVQPFHEPDRVFYGCADIWAFSPNRAAEKWAKRQHLDLSRSIVVEVIDDNDNSTVWGIYSRVQVRYHAVQKEETKTE